MSADLLRRPSDIELQEEIINWLRHGCALATYFVCNASSPAAARREHPVRFSCSCRLSLPAASSLPAKDLAAHRYLSRSEEPSPAPLSEDEEPSLPSSEPSEALFSQLQGQAGALKS